MSSSCFQRLCTFVVLLTLTLPAFQMNWQAAGNMNDTVMAEIRSGIASGRITSVTSATSIDDIAMNISLRLNKFWDPAWNVVITKSVTNMDTIVYGYAFNGHWMWICGSPIPMTVAETVDYVIWKDYNCKNWATMSDLTTAGSGFSSALQN